ncbi:MAG: hypothetical protein ABW184_03055 [Sphingobium sp.]
MIALSAAIATMLAAATPALAQQQVVEHRGTSYQVRYEPHVTVRTKTVGLSAGPRQTTQSCRWTMAVQVERHIGQSGGGQPLAKLLPEERRFSGSLPGDCRGRTTAIAAEQDRRDADIRGHVAAVASADRPTLLAEIDAVRALALN